MPTTTIEITETQKDTLDELKDHKAEAYKSVLGRLIDCYRNGDGKPMGGYSDGIDVDELAEEIRSTPNGDIDESELAKAVAREIDYHHIADSVAEQVTRELR